MDLDNALFCNHNTIIRVIKQIKEYDSFSIIKE